MLCDIPEVQEIGYDKQDSWEVEQERNDRVYLLFSRDAGEALGSLDALPVIVDREQWRNDEPSTDQDRCDR